MNKMYLLLLIFMSCLTCQGCAVFSSGAKFDQSLVNVTDRVIEKEYAAQKGQKLSINLRSGGSITIEGWDKNLIKVKLEYSYEKADEDIFNMKQHGDLFDIDISPGFFNTRINNVHLFINVPDHFDIGIQSMGGDINISDVEGNFYGKTLGGPINLDKIKGKTELTTNGGKIHVTDSDLDGTLKSNGGEIWFENIMGEVTGRSLGGSIKIDGAPDGANVSTNGGDIYIKNAQKHIKAKTMGGNIEIENINGQVTATTMGGDIRVAMTGGDNQTVRDVDLRSMGGKIELTLPEEFSADFKIKLAYKKNSPQNFKIKSDFDLKIEESDKWSYLRGTPRKDITATGKSKDGKSCIDIKTINGDVVIKKDSYAY